MFSFIVQCIIDYLDKWRRRQKGKRVKNEARKFSIVLLLENKLNICILFRSLTI